jgi:2'-5' RNA ligase
MSDVRFIIITVPPPDVAAALEAPRRAAAERSGSRAALAFPPHVTLRTGAVVPALSISEFAVGVRVALGPWRPFTIRAPGLFHTPYENGGGGLNHMVGWRVEVDEPLLRLHKALLSFDRFQRRAQPRFEPHVTLAFDDLEESDAVTLLAEARSRPDLYPPALSWTCDNVGLYRLCDETWEPYIVFHPQEAVS